VEDIDEEENTSSSSITRATRKDPVSYTSDFKAERICAK
jgi:hypothetical protein